MSKRAASDTAASSKRFRSAIHESVDEFLCPITHSLPLEPVLAEDGKVYERKAVETWLKEHQKSPCTNMPMGSKLVPATQIKNMIERMVKCGALSDELVAEWQERIAEQEKVERTRTSAEGGDIDAASTLGSWYLRGEHGLEMDKAKAFSFLIKGATGGNARAMGKVATLFRFGEGVAKNEALGLRWAAAGTALGNGGCMMVLANFFTYGLAGLTVDFEEAFALRRQALEKGAANSVGILNIGLAYAHGAGTAINMEKAADTMRQAIAHGRPEVAVGQARDWLVARGLAEVP